jgi:hypothetical protein
MVRNWHSFDTRGMHHYVLEVAVLNGASRRLGAGQLSRKEEARRKCRKVDEGVGAKCSFHIRLQQR